MAEFAQYREITAKLKKRFTLRKPNFREASESFKKLAGELADFKDYAGYCMLSAAQCEHNIVGSLREQQLSSSTAPFSSSSTLRTSSPRPGSAVASNLFLGTGGVGLERVLQTATLTEFQTLVETARLFKEAGEVNGAIAAFSHAAQVCPLKLLPLLYAEWADMFRGKERYFEAADVYLEGGLLREAIDCLLTGQHFEEAYHCFQELFKMASKEPAIISGISRSASSTSAKSPATRTALPFFGRQKSTESSTKSVNSSSKATGHNSLHQPPIGSDGGPFAGTDHLTIDDYITAFLLRLYLYDPVKYEYPSPIIPLPAGLVHCNLNLKLNLTNRTNIEDETEQSTQPADQTDQNISTSTSSASGTGGTSGSQTVRANSGDFTLAESFLPFIDFLNCPRTERTIAQLIELNMLLETLYLSYRNELRHTIDHDYANDDSWSDSSSTEDSDSELDEFHDASQQPNTSPPFKTTITSDSTDAAIVHFATTRRDSVDDDPPTTTTTTTNATSSSSAFEKNDLDDIGLKLEQLALQYGGSSRSRKSSKNRPVAPKGPPETGGGSGTGVDFTDLDRKFTFQQRMRATEGDQDQRLRRQIVTKLFPLLNSHQNQLVYLIQKNKD